MNKRFLFAKRFLSRPTSVGSLWPSSQKLALSMIPSPSCSQDPIDYLEVGAGSGALTCRLVEKLRPQDRLDIVENDPKFCALLRKQFGHLSQVTIHELSILDFTGKKYEVIISSLPLNAFPAHLVAKILEQYESLSKKGGVLSYFEYVWLEKIKQALLCGAKAQDFREALTLKQRFAAQYGKKVELIWGNVPPARVIHCQM